MTYNKYLILIFTFLLTSLLSAQSSINMQQVPDNVQKQLNLLSPAEQKKLLKRYNLNEFSDLDLAATQISSLKENTETNFLNVEKKLSMNSTYNDDRGDEENTEDARNERFGMSFFSQYISTFAPMGDVSVPDNYVLGIGDSLVIQTMGASFDRYELQVQRDGNIIIENLGMVAVTGLTIDQVSSMIKERFSQQLFGLEVSVNLGNLRAMNIFMAGEVKNPGMYTVSSLTTITQALYQAGGITDLGSLREISVIRNGVNTVNFDAYDLLVYGDATNDIRLRSGDVVLITPYKKLATVQGESKRPMIYEMLPNDTLSSLLRISSGFSPQASPENAVLISKKAFDRSPEVRTVNLLAKQDLDIVLGVNDTLIIPKSNQNPNNYIELIGALNRPGPIGWQKGMLLSNVFSNLEDDFPDYADLDFSLISRKSANSNNREYLAFSLRNLFNDKSNNDIELEEFDTLYIFSVSKEPLTDIPSDGVVSEENELENLVDIEKIENDESNEFVGKSKSLLSAEGLKFTREKLLEDEIEIAQINSSREKSLSVVSISGAVKFPGKYPLFKDADVAALINAAGGYDESAYLKSAELRRMNLDEFTTSTQLKEIDLTNLNSDSENLDLKSLDHLHVRSVADWGTERLISLSGEVRYPGVYRISSEDNLITIIERAGGLKDTAFIKGAIYQKEILKELELERLKKYQDSLKQTFSASSLTKENLDIDTLELQNILTLIDSIEPSGRVSIDWSNEKEIQSFVIDDGDSLFIPKVTNFVQVLGEVNVPTIINYAQNLTVEDYINLAGGLTKRADSDIYVIKANGSSIILEKSLFRLLGNKPIIEPGDSIVAPVNIQYTDSLTNWTQITQLIYQSMVSLAAVKGL